MKIQIPLKCDKKLTNFTIQKYVKKDYYFILEYYEILKVFFLFSDKIAK